MKVIIAGSRDLFNYQALVKVIRDSGYDITEVVCGMARGMDTVGKMWAEQNGIHVKKFPAEWSKFGKAAGIIRNKQMAKYADAAIVIWDGKSRGSFNMICEMEGHGKPCLSIIVTSGEA